jgi:hypothetical protein
MLKQLTTTEKGRTYVAASNVRNFLEYINEVDPGRFVVARGRLWYFCDNPAKWIQCDAFRSEYGLGVAVVYFFDVTDALNPDAETIDLN